MAYTIPLKRCGTASHLFLVCLVYTIYHVSIPPSMAESRDLCRFCVCTPFHLSCMGVFREGNILEHLSREEDLTHLNIPRPPTKLSHELFKDYQNISHLDVSQNHILSLDKDFFLVFRRLISVDLTNNELQKIPVLGNNTYLSSLKLKGNSLREISKDLRFDAPNIMFISLNNNYVKVLHGSHLPRRLKIINLSRNKIIALTQDTLEGLNLLKTIDLSYNNITFITSYALSLPSLTSVNLAHNRIAAIHPLALPQDVLTLTLSVNSLSELSYLKDLRSLNSLKFINLFNIDNFTNVPLFEGLMQVRATNVRNPGIVGTMMSKSPTLHYMYVTNGKLTEINALEHTTLLYLDLSSNRIGLIGKPLSLPSLEMLQLRNNRLTVLPNVSGLLYLKVLDLTQNEIIQLTKNDLLNLPRLNRIVLDHNQIISVDVQYLFRNLHVFSASHNQIADMHHLMSLKVRRLDVDGNKMKTFRLTVIGRISINFLKLNENHIDAIDPESFKDMVVLQLLSMAHNKITQIRDLPSFPALTSLSLDYNPLQFIGADIFLSLPKLEELSLRSTQITTMPEIRGTFPFVKIINLQKNALVEFPINISHNFPNITILNLNDNKISHWYTGMMASLKELRSLYIINNPIQTFDVGTTIPTHLNILALGSVLTEYINLDILNSIANITKVELKGSRSVRIQDDFFCKTSQMSALTMDGLMLDGLNNTCLPSLLTLSNILIERSFLDEIISHGASIGIINISLTEPGQLNKNNSIVFAKALQDLSYTNSRLTEVPRVIAPAARLLNLSGNHLTSFSFGTLTRFFPSLRYLYLANNHIRVLSSCGMWHLQHPLQFMNLDGNLIGRFSHWICADGLVFLRALRELNLSDNNLSFLSQELLHPSLLANNYALNIFSYKNPHICTCDQRWLIGYRGNLEVVGGQCVFPQDNKGQEISDLVDSDFPCKPMMSDNRICTISANNTILVECPALGSPNPVIAWVLKEPLDSANNIGLFINLSRRSSECSDACAEHQPLELTLDEGVSGDGEHNFLFSLTCLASNLGGSLAIDVNVNITHDLNRAANLSLPGVNQSVAVQCHSKGHIDGGVDESEEIDRAGNGVNRSSRVNIAVDENSGFPTMLCCFLLHILLKDMVY